MNDTGLKIACRYAFPPNRLHLCGPERQTDFAAYTKSGQTDKGTIELLTQFATFYPYLQLIAGENNIKDPFDPKVVMAYWIGNSYLKHIKNTSLISHLDDTLGLHKKLKSPVRTALYDQVSRLPLPHHNFHVMAIWQRTGNTHTEHTIQSMDACIINWGKVVKIEADTVLVETHPLVFEKDILSFGPRMQRKLLLAQHTSHNDNHSLLATGRRSQLTIDSIVSYHWGVVCDALTPTQLTNLKYFTNLALTLINS